MVFSEYFLSVHCGNLEQFLAMQDSNLEYLHVIEHDGIYPIF